MTETEWLASEDARAMIVSGFCRASGRKWRLLTVACCRCNRQLMANLDHRAAIDLAERFADGLATELELTAVHRRTDELAMRRRNGKSEPEIRRWAEAVAVLQATRLPDADASDVVWNLTRAAEDEDCGKQLANHCRDVVGNPFHPINPEWLLADAAAPVRSMPQPSRWRFDPKWMTSDVVTLARQMYESREFSAMPILADALQDAGCNNDGILNHCRGDGPHVRGCWVVDLILSDYR